MAEAILRKKLKEAEGEDGAEYEVISRSISTACDPEGSPASSQAVEVQ